MLQLYRKRLDPDTRLMFERVITVLVVVAGVFLVWFFWKPEPPPPKIYLDSQGNLIENVCEHLAEYPIYYSDNQYKIHVNLSEVFKLNKFNYELRGLDRLKHGSGEWILDIPEYGYFSKVLRSPVTSEEIKRGYFPVTVVENHDDRFGEWHERNMTFVFLANFCQDFFDYWEQLIDFSPHHCLCMPNLGVLMNGVCIKRSFQPTAHDDHQIPTGRYNSEIILNVETVLQKNMVRRYRLLPQDHHVEIPQRKIKYYNGIKTVVTDDEHTVKCITICEKHNVRGQ